MEKELYLEKINNQMLEGFHMIQEKIVQEARVKRSGAVLVNAVSGSHGTVNFCRVVCCHQIQQKMSLKLDLTKPGNRHPKCLRQSDCPQNVPSAN